jgi:branched-chain amino acid transport system substrate-binding protein
MYDPKLLEVAGPAAEGAVFSYPTFDTKSSQPLIAEFVKAYQAKFGAEPDAFAAQGYDAYRVMEKALAGGPAKNGPDIARRLREIGTYEGPGGRISFDQFGDVQKPLRLITVRDGKFVDEGGVLQ